MRASEFITEKWSKKYKKSINCANPRGFSQKAHCAGRKARQAGKDTSSDSVSEEQVDELMFKGSQCTKDCSGHRAGYEWYKRKGYQPASWSNSFNKGAAIAAAGK